MAVTLITGDDDLLLLRATQARIREISADRAEIEWQQFDVQELDQLPEMRTASLFATRAGVVLRGVEAVSPELKTALEAYVLDPAVDTELVLVAKGIGKIPTVKKHAAANGTVIEVKLPPEWNDKAWDQLVADEFAQHSRACDSSAIAAVREYAGFSPTQLASQVRTVVGATPQDLVTRRDVEAVLTVLSEAGAFAVADAYVARDPGAALVAVRAALRAGVAPLAIVGALVWRTRQLLLARGGADAKEAAVRSPQQWRRIQLEAARFTPGELAWCHDRLAALDVDLKSTDAADTVVLELGLLELATTRNVSSPFNPLAAVAR